MLVKNISKEKDNGIMKAIRKSSKIFSVGLASSMLFATTAMGFGMNPSAAIIEDTSSEPVEEIYFSKEECGSCKYITVYDQNSTLLYDGLVDTKVEIQDEKLIRLLNKSDFIMRNEITDYYILSK